MAGSVSSEDGDMGLQIAPMVDVVFVLLLFFMASAGTKIVEKELSLNLPSPNWTRSTPITPIVIELSSDGQIRMNDRPFGSSEDRSLLPLREWLRGTLTEFGKKNPVIIRPSPDARQERIIDVLNACAAARVVNVTFG